MLSLKNIIKVSCQILLAFLSVNPVNLQADQQSSEGEALATVVPTGLEAAALRQKSEYVDFTLHDIQVGFGKFFAFSQGYIAHLREQDPTRQNQLISIIQCADKMHHEIITAFRNGCFEKDYELIIKFENIFRGQQFDLSIQPRHLRKLRKRISKFNDFFQHYRFTKKHSLSLDELQVFEKIITLNSLMTDIILTENFFSFGVVDKSTDVLLFKPAEFVARHKLFFTILTLAAIAGGCYWIYRSNQSGSDEMYRVSTDEFDIEQLRVLRQSGNTCAVHALFNAHCMLRANGNKAEAAKLCADEKTFTTFLAEVKKIHPKVAEDGLQDQEIRDLCERFKIPRDHILIVPSKNALKTHTISTRKFRSEEDRPQYEALEAQWAAAGKAGKDAEVRRLEGLMGHFFDEIDTELCSIRASDADFAIKMAGLRDKEPLVVIYNSGSHPGDTDDEMLDKAAYMLSHWTALGLHNKDIPAEPLATAAKKKFDVLFADSLNGNGGWIRPVVEQIISLTKPT